MKPRSSPRSGGQQGSRSGAQQEPRSGAQKEPARSGERNRSRGDDGDRSSYSAGPRSSHKAKGPTQRQLRVAEELRHLLADVFTRVEFHDKQLHGARLTISEVRISPDLKHATIFLTRLGNQDVTPLLPALARAAPFLRAQIAPKLGLRITPDLKFLVDAALDEAVRMNRLLRSPEVARDLGE